MWTEWWLKLLWVQSLDWGCDWHYCELSHWTEGVTDIIVSSVIGLGVWLTLLWVQSLGWGCDWHYCEFSHWTESVTDIIVSSVIGLRVWLTLLWVQSLDWGVWLTLLWAQSLDCVTDIIVSSVIGLGVWLTLVWVHSIDWGCDWHYCESSQWTEGATYIAVSSFNGLRVWLALLWVLSVDWGCYWHYCESSPGLRVDWHYCECSQWTEAVTGIAMSAVSGLRLWLALLWVHSMGWGCDWITVSPVRGLRVDWRYCESCQWTEDVTNAGLSDLVHTSCWC